MSIRERILALIQRFEPGSIQLTDETDIFVDCGIDGDDACEFTDEFSTEFGVEMSAYRWYFHHEEEGLKPGGLFVTPPYRRVKHIPVTIPLLVQAAEQRVWPDIYPPHTLPSERWDIRINQGCFVIFLVGSGLIWLALQAPN